MPLADRVRWAGDSGFGAVSFQDEQFALGGPMGVGDEVGRLVTKLGLDVTVHPTPAVLSTPGREPAFRGAIARAAEFQRATGRVRSIGIDPAWTSKEGIVIYDPLGTLRSLEVIARAVEGLGVAVAVENWKINPEREEFLRLAAELGPGVALGLLFDLGHLHVMTDDPVGAARDLPLPVREVHVSDNDGRNDDHLPIGRGNLPIDEIARVLKAGGFDGIWTLETRAQYNFARCTIRNPRAVKSLVKSRRRVEAALAAASGNGTQQGCTG